MSAAGILNAKMEKVFGWVKTHAANAGGPNAKHSHADKQRARSQDGLELRDFAPHPRGQDPLDPGELLDLKTLLATRPLPSLDLLPPFYHDKAKPFLQDAATKGTSFITTKNNNNKSKTSTKTSAQSSHIYEEISEEPDLEARRKKHFQVNENPDSLDPRYQAFASGRPVVTTQQLLALLNRKKVEKKVVFNLEADHEALESPESPLTKRLSDQRSSSYGQLPKELLVSSARPEGPRDPALLLDIQTLESLRELQLQSDGSSRYVRAHSASPGVQTSPEVTPRLSPKHPRDPSKAPSPNLFPASPASPRASPRPRHSSRASPPPSSSDSPNSHRKVQNNSCDNDNRPQIASQNLNHSKSRRLSPQVSRDHPLDASPRPPGATPLHFLPGYEIPLPSSQSQSPVSSPRASPPHDEPNYHDELAKIERNLLHKNTVSTIIELEGALEKVKEEVRFEGQLLGPGELPRGHAGHAGVSPRMGRHRRKGHERKTRSASCGGVKIQPEEGHEDALAPSGGAHLAGGAHMPGGATPKIRNKKVPKGMEKLSCRATDRPANLLLSSKPHPIPASPKLESLPQDSCKPTNNSFIPAEESSQREHGYLTNSRASMGFHLSKCYDYGGTRNLYKNKFLNELIYLNNARL